MTLEFICASEIYEKCSIVIPENSKYYRCKSGKIKFFCGESNQEHSSQIPSRAQTVSFPRFCKLTFWTNYGEPIFYDRTGNILKEEKLE